MGTNDFYDDANRRHSRKQRDDQEDKENLIMAAEDFLDQHTIHEVLSLNGALFFRAQDGSWAVCSSAKLGGHFPLCRKPKFMDALVSVMDDRGHNHLKATYSYKPVHSDTLNLVDTSRWLQPITDQPHHWIFDVLMQSLGGNKAENIEHLEHCIVHKREYPENSHHLPCILIHGEGSVGKNVLVNVVLKRLFDGQTVSTNKTNVMDGFNSIIEGQAVVLIDEGAEGFANELKITVGNPEITINRKNCPQFQSDNLAWYFVSSNSDDKGIWLDRTTADRRFSVLKVNEGETFAYWIAKKQGLDDVPPEKHDEILDAVRQWQLTEGNQILSDPTEIAKWFGNLWMKHGEKGIPKALHGEDYKDLLDVQTPAHDRLIKAIFEDEDFTHIARATINHCYDLMCRQHRVKVPMRDLPLRQRIMKYLKKHPHIEMKRVWQGDKYPWLFVNTNAPERMRKTSNCDRYVSRSEGQPFYCGPELD